MSGPGGNEVPDLSSIVNSNKDPILAQKWDEVKKEQQQIEEEAKKKK